MAERLTTEEREQIQAFVHRLYDAAGYKSWAEFAREARVSEFGLSDWRSGRGAPSAINLLRLLAAAGVIGEDFALEAAPSSAPNGNGSTRDDALAAMQADVRTLLQSVEQMLSRLEGFAGPDAARWLSDGQAAEGSPGSPPAQQR